MYARDYDALSEEELDYIKGNIHADELEEALATLRGYSSKHIQGVADLIDVYIYSIVKGKRKKLRKYHIVKN